MTTNEPSGQEASESVDERRGIEAVAKRVSRALDEFFHAEATSNLDEFRVHSGSGDTYTVNLSDGACTCPDGQRGPWCKHAYRVLFERGELPSVVGSGVVTSETGDADATTDDEHPTEDEDGGDGDMFTERIERFEANNPGASAIEAIAQLEIDPAERERVEEVLA